MDATGLKNKINIISFLSVEIHVISSFEEKIPLRYELIPIF
jgi:hypothetical protein